MKKYTFLFCTGILLSFNTTQAQGLLKKLKEKASSVAEKAIDKKTDDLIYGKKAEEQVSGNSKSGVRVDENGNVIENPYTKNVNTTGAGLVSTQPDVLQNLNESEKSFDSNALGEARYNLKQAMQGIEMEIGKKVLADLPQKLNNLQADASEDKVISSGWGWEGLSLTKVYKADNQQLTLNMINNGTLVSAYNNFIAMGSYGSSNPNMKAVKVKSYKAIVEYSDHDGYKLTVPLGQGTILIFNGLNFKDEAQFLGTVNLIDIEKIKTSLD